MDFQGDAVAAVAFAGAAVVAAYSAVVKEATRRVRLLHAAVAVAAVGLFAEFTRFVG